MKKTGIILLTLTLCGLLTACGGGQTAAAEGSSEAATDSPIVKLDTETLSTAAEESGRAVESTEPETAKAEPGKTDTDQADGDKSDGDKSDAAENYTAVMKNSYVSALEALLRENIYPDGTDIGNAVTSTMSDNQFAVYDVDQDGKEELIVLFTSTYMAGMRGSVFAYDNETGTMTEELSEFPALTFYDNGYVKVDASHNQGLAGGFWPYSLYRHRTDSDRYELTAMVDAWDRQLSETDYENRQFPEEVDKSKTGVVYYIMTDGSYDTGNPVDLADYDKWIDTCIGNASELPIQYLNLTEENVSRLGK